MRLSSGTKRAFLAVGGATLGLALVLAFAGPASAASVRASRPSSVSLSTPSPSSTPPALKAWLEAPSITESSVSDASSAASQAKAAKAASAKLTTKSVKQSPLVSGSRITEYRGGTLLWTENILEWYWSSSKITSSNGSQSVGYVFPNTAKANGLTKTYSSASLQNWRGKETVGAGVVTPWGAIDVYETTENEYFTLNRGGTYSYTTS